MTEDTDQTGADESGGLVRSGVAMAVGTLASRGTGFLRTVVIAAALGSTLGDPYNIANTIPNILYDLLLGGVLASVVIPLLVQAARDGEEAGRVYAQRLVTIVATVLTAAAVVGVLLAPQIIHLYSGSLPDASDDLAATFARYFLPQVVFYGVGAVLGAILNTRGQFAAPMWAPVLNNIAVIVTGALFLGVTHASPRAGELTDGQTLLLALGTTGGVVLQTIALLPFLRRVGIRLRPRWDWRGAGFRAAGPFAAWVVGYVLTNQVGYWVIVKLASASGAARHVAGFGFSPYAYAFVLFSLPYAVISVSVITALFPQMSRSALESDTGAVAETLARGLLLSAVVHVPATVALVALGPLLATVVFAYGNLGLGGARLIGGTLAGFGVGLVPFSAFQIQLRAFLALRDSRTPFLVNIGVTAVNVAADIALYLVLPTRTRVVGLAVGFSLSYLVGTLVLGRLLRTRLGSPPQPVAQTLARLAVAALVAAVPTYAAARLLTAGLGLGVESALVASIVSVLVGGAVFLAVARRMRIAELEQVLRLVQRRVRPG
jgi:putative peptidoglycan lipid II flippase